MRDTFIVQVLKNTHTAIWVLTGVLPTRARVQVPVRVIAIAKVYASQHTLRRVMDPRRIFVTALKVITVTGALIQMATTIPIMKAAAPVLHQCRSPSVCQGIGSTHLLL